jgi:hypothetical protein
LDPALAAEVTLPLRKQLFQMTNGEGPTTDDDRRRPTNDRPTAA